MAFWKKGDKNEQDNRAPTEEISKLGTETNKPLTEKDDRQFTLGKANLETDSEPAPRWETSPAKNSETTSGSKDTKPTLVTAEKTTPSYQAGQVRSALGAGALVQGKLSFDEPVQIDGSLSGEVISSSTLVVGPTGKIEADVQAKELIVYGKVEGNIKVSKSIIVHTDASLDGVVQTELLKLSKGGTLNADCTVGKARQTKTTSERKLEKLAG